MVQHADAPITNGDRIVPVAYATLLDAKDIMRQSFARKTAQDQGAERPRFYRDLARQAKSLRRLTRVLEAHEQGRQTLDRQAHLSVRASVVVDTVRRILRIASDLAADAAYGQDQRLTLSIDHAAHIAAALNAALDGSVLAPSLRGQPIDTTDSSDRAPAVHGEDAKPADTPLDQHEYSVDEVADLLGLTQDTIRGALRHGRLHGHRGAGKRTLISRTEIERYSQYRATSPGWQAYATPRPSERATDDESAQSPEIRAAMPLAEPATGPSMEQEQIEYTPRDAAARLGIKPDSIRGLISTGRLTARRGDNGQILIPRNEIERYDRERQGKGGWAKRRQPGYSPSPAAIRERGQRARKKWGESGGE